MTIIDAPVLRARRTTRTAIIAALAATVAACAELPSAPSAAPSVSPSGGAAPAVQVPTAAARASGFMLSSGRDK